MTTTDTEDEVELYSAKLKIRPRSKANEHFRRNDIRVNVDRDPYNDDCVISLDVDEGWGHPTVYTELTPAEARALAMYLATAANEADRLEEEEES